MTCGLHYYKGMLMGLAMQVVMAPFNLWENPLVKSIIKRIALEPENTVFDEKLSITELGEEAEVVDEQGRVIMVGSSSPSSTATALLEGSDKDSGGGGNLATLLLDTWDAGAKADVGKLVSRLTKDNINTITDPDNRWTALMILSGLKHTPESSLRKCIDELGAQLDMIDQDGWTCLHWAAFHGNETAASVLIAAEPSLATTRDRQQQIPLDVAVSEKSEGVVKVLQTKLKKNQ
jgi:Ankyrin repeats (many copies)